MERNEKKRSRGEYKELLNLYYLNNKDWIINSYCKLTKYIILNFIIIIIFYLLKRKKFSIVTFSIEILHVFLSHIE